MWGQGARRLLDNTHTRQLWLLHFPPPNPLTDSQLPALSYLELQDRGQGKKRGREMSEVFFLTPLKRANKVVKKVQESALTVACPGIVCPQVVSVWTAAGRMRKAPRAALWQLLSAYLQCQTKCLPPPRLRSAATSRQDGDASRQGHPHWLREVSELMPHVASTWFKVQKPYS